MWQQPPISEYGLIGDTRTAALIARGSVDWLCLPRFDSDPLFGRLVGGPDAGHFTVAPSTGRSEPVVRYRPDSAVLETVWPGRGWELRLTDGLVADVSVGLRPQVLLVRRVEAVGGPCDVRIGFVPRRAATGRVPRRERRGDVFVCSWGDLALGVSTEPALGLTGDQEEVTVSVAPGRPLTIAMAMAHREPLVHISPERAWRLLEQTDRWWRDWTRDLAAHSFARDVVVRSMITLRLLTYAPSGAVIASPTTSLPEWPGATRNWDYRYAWPRDASIGIAASLAVGKHDEAAAFLYWLLHAGRVNRPRLPPAMSVDGRPTPPERKLEDWPGYRGSRPVRLGNAASRQHQLDGYGWVVDGVWAYRRAGKPIFRETWRMVAQLADFVAGHWREPDAGIWEMRREPRHFVHSKLMAWLALDRALRLAQDHRTRQRRLRRWRRERDALAADVRRRGFEERRRTYVQAYGREELDAALLLLPILEFHPPESERVVGTIDAVRRELSAGDPLLYRYPPGQDGLEGEEGAFLPCSFWLVQALAATGRREEAAEVFEDLLGRCSPLGLFGEEMHPQTGEHLGNMPMVFTHGALIQAAMALGEVDVR